MLKSLKEKKVNNNLFDNGYSNQSKKKVFTHLVPDFSF